PGLLSCAAAAGGGGVDDEEVLPGVVEPARRGELVPQVLDDLDVARVVDILPPRGVVTHNRVTLPPLRPAERNSNLPPSGDQRGDWFFRVFPVSLVSLPPLACTR